MEFGLDKCAKATFKGGKKVSAEGILLNDHQLIQDLDQAETYKYLGMEEGEGVQHHQMKVKIKKKYKRRIKLVLNSELNVRKACFSISSGGWSVVFSLSGDCITRWFGELFVRWYVSSLLGTYIHQKLF